MALLALSNISTGYEMKRELYLNEIREIIEYHQKHHNLASLAYQSAWSFLMNRFWDGNGLEGEIVNVMHFAREAARELEELARCIDWKREKEEEMGKEMKEELVLMRWFNEILVFYFRCCRLKNEEFAGLIGGIACVLSAAKVNNGVISNQCVFAFVEAAENRTVNVEGFLKGGAVDAVLEGIQRRTVGDGMLFDCLQFFANVSERLKEKTENEMEEVKRKAIKRKVFDKMEEEGYEDVITSFQEIFYFFEENFDSDISMNISDYFVNI